MECYDFRKESNLFENLNKCFEKINFSMGEKDFFLLGFYMGLKYVEEKSALESGFDNVLQIYINQYIFDRDITIFDIKNKNENNFNNINFTKENNKFSLLDSFSSKSKSEKNLNTNTLNHSIPLLNNNNLNNNLIKNNKNLNKNNYLTDTNLLEKSNNDIENFNFNFCYENYLIKEEKKEQENIINKQNDDDKIIIDENILSQNNSNIYKESNDNSLNLVICNICQNEFLSENIENVKLDCEHIMHFECFKTYIIKKVNFF